MNKGFKVTNSDLTCRGFKFELGKTYEHKGDIGLCEQGFHFCLKAADCFSYYSFSSDNRVFEIEFGEEVEHGNDKSVTNEITLIRELDWKEVLDIVNTGKENTGINNSGYRNSGYRNSGDSNSGDSNSGDSNSGDSNSGDSNSGDSNSGNWNSGDSNSGDSNSGNWNSGNWNSGSWNSGYRNSGDSNSGYRNSGNWNSGSWNSGYRNSGDSNSGYRNSGAFCTDNDPKIYLFNKECDMTVREWENHECYRIMCDLDPTIWVSSDMMSESEKKKYPSYETTGGYLKTISLKEAWSNLWANLSEEKQQLFKDLPNFNADIFEEITGIKTK